MRIHSLRNLAGVLFTGALLAMGSAQAGQAAARGVSVTLIHTNDLHSHYRPEKTVLGLGGVARIKTIVDGIRASHANTLFIDGGDWSDGNIYYNLSAGVESLRMMDFLGYDVAVVGNHDWLNGPDNLIDSYARAKPRVSLIAANVNLDNYERKNEFQKTVLPYVIKEVGGVKIAFIGIVTYEYIYDSFFKPIRIDAPQDVVRDLAAELRSQVDAIVVVSHNAIKRNEELLRAAPDVDLVIGAHDHVKLTKPDVVKRDGAPDGWVVETGAWGRFVGQVQINVQSRAAADSAGVPSVSLVDYRLTQVDSTVPENQAALDRVTALEAALEKQYKAPIFHDHVVDTEVELNRESAESVIGNFTTDAFMEGAPDADLALDQVNFIYGEMHPGKLTTADFINTYPAIYNPQTGKTWTLKTIGLTGHTLKWALNLLYAAGKHLPVGDIGASTISTSGMSFTYSPLFGAYFNGLDLVKAPQNLWYVDRIAIDSQTALGLVIQDLRVKGKPIDDDQTYRVAIGNGILYAIQYINSILPNAIPMDDVRETGKELWSVLKDHAAKLGTITFAKVPLGNRVRTSAPDLGVYSSQITWQPVGDVRALPSGKNVIQAKVRAIVTNYGASASHGGMAKLLANMNGADETVDDQFQEAGVAAALPDLKPGQSVELQWEGQFIGDHGKYPVTVSIEEVPDEINGSNNRITHWFKIERARR